MPDLPPRQIKMRRKRNDGGPSAVQERIMLEEAKSILRMKRQLWALHLKQLAHDPEELRREGRMLFHNELLTKFDPRKYIYLEGLREDPAFVGELRDLLLEEERADAEARIRTANLKARGEDYEERRRFNRSVEQRVILDALDDARRRRELQDVAQVLAAIAPVIVPVIAQALGVNPNTLQLPPAGTASAPSTSPTAEPFEPSTPPDSPAPPVSPAPPASLLWGPFLRRKGGSKMPGNQVATPPPEPSMTPDLSPETALPGDQAG